MLERLLHQRSCLECLKPQIIRRIWHLSRLVLARCGKLALCCGGVNYGACGGRIAQPTWTVPLSR